MEIKKFNKHFIFFNNLEFLINTSPHIKNVSSLAKEIGCDRSAFVKAKERHSLPKVDIVEACAKVFNISMESLLNDDLEKFDTIKKIHVIDAVTSKTIAIESHELGFTCHIAFRFLSELKNFKYKYVYVQSRAYYKDFSKVIINKNHNYFVKILRIIENKSYFTTIENMDSLESKNTSEIIGEIVKVIYKTEY